MIINPKGRELADDLARHLMWGNMMAWTEVPLGPGGFERADVIAVARSSSSKRFVIYEIKVSKSDFTNDVNTGKFLKYKKSCDQLYFATPRGLVTKAEVPDGCGLITRSDKGWRVAKAASRNAEFVPSTDLMIRLLLRGYENHFQEYRDLEKKKLKEDMSLYEMANIVGSKIATQMADASNVIERAEELIKECETELGESLSEDGLAQAIFKLEWRVEELIRRKTFSKEAVELTSVVMDMFEGRSSYRYVEKLREIADRIAKVKDTT